VIKGSDQFTVRNFNNDFNNIFRCFNLNILQEKVSKIKNLNDLNDSFNEFKNKFMKGARLFSLWLVINKCF
jgi:hypothetical protein